MVSRFAFEALDRTLRDIMCFTIDNSLHKTFGEKVVILNGDFKQILFVVPNASKVEIILATINSSQLWKCCKTLKLTQNMRLKSGLNDVDESEKMTFSYWILSLGDGPVGNYNNGEIDIGIPHSLIVNNSHKLIQDIVESIYCDLFHNLGIIEYF